MSSGEILDFCKTNGKAATVKHFMTVGVHRSKIFRVLKKGTTARKERNDKGKPRVDKKVLKSSIEKLVVKVGQSYRTVARKSNISKSCLFYHAKKAKVAYKKRRKAPKVSERQLQVQKERLPRLKVCLARRRKNRRCDVVMDDESYFTLDGSAMPGNCGYHSRPGDIVPLDIQTHPVDKFPVKVLVWVAISPKGMSSIFIAPSRSASINSTTYVEKCLRPKLLPFLKSTYPNKNYTFWPDLASSHYSAETLSFLETEKIPFVPKSDNPPNAPALRPIESFWGILKQQVYKNGWSAADQDQLQSRIKRIAHSMDVSSFSKMMKKVPRKVASVCDDGLASLY